MSLWLWSMAMSMVTCHPDRHACITHAWCHALLLLIWCHLCTGLELIENVLSPDEQANMIAIVEDWVVQVRMPDYTVHSGVVRPEARQQSCSGCMATTTIAHNSLQTRQCVKAAVASCHVFGMTLLSTRVSHAVFP